MWTTALYKLWCLLQADEYRLQIVTTFYFYVAGQLHVPSRKYLLKGAAVRGTCAANHPRRMKGGNFNGTIRIRSRTGCRCTSRSRQRHTSWYVCFRYERHYSQLRQRRHYRPQVGGRIGHRSRYGALLWRCCPTSPWPFRV